MEQYFLQEQITYGNTTKPFVISDDGHLSYFKPIMDNTNDAQEKFCLCFFANSNFIVLFERHTGKLLSSCLIFSSSLSLNPEELKKILVVVFTFQKV